MKKFIDYHFDKIIFGAVTAFALAAMISLCALTNSKDNNGFRNLAAYGVESYVKINNK